MFYDYLKKFDFDKLSSIRIICNKFVEDDDEFFELCHVFSLHTYEFSIIFDLKDLFNSFSIDSIEHDIIDGQLIIMVKVYE